MSIQSHQKKVEEIQMQHVCKHMARPTSVNDRYHLWKRLFDITISFGILLGSLPLFILLAILIMVFSGGPIFFIQTRTGADSKRFSVFKFRTMTVSRHNEKTHTYNWKEGVPDSFRFKTSNDSAVTPIERILRKSSLDKLPQLLNVLAGDMSIGGSRPEIPAITDLYNAQQAKSLLVKPGITGYAQINGRSEICHGKK